MSVINSIVFASIAGLMNGTYALPIKYMRKWRDENIWLIFSPIAFILTPWLCLFAIDNKIFTFLANIPVPVLYILISSGFLFGIGMITFTFSLRFVGLGIAFILNISTGTIIGSLLPIIVLAPQRLFSYFGMAEIISLLLFCFGMYVSCLASMQKKEQASVSQFAKKNIFFGIMLGIASGVLTSAQGFAYAYASPVLQTVSHQLGFSNLIAMNIAWLPLFTAAFIPYFSYFLFKSIQAKSISNLLHKSSFAYCLLCLMMGVLYFGSLIIFSQASLSLGNMGAVIAWPMLMIFIILTSNLWSFVHGEWREANPIALRYIYASLAALVFAIVSLSIAGYLNIHYQ